MFIFNILCYISSYPQAKFADSKTECNFWSSLDVNCTSPISKTFFGYNTSHADKTSLKCMVNMFWTERWVVFPMHGVVFYSMGHAIKSAWHSGVCSTKHKSHCKNGVCNRCITDNYRSKFHVAYKALCLEMREFGVRLQCGIAKGSGWNLPCDSMKARLSVTYKLHYLSSELHGSCGESPWWMDAFNSSLIV